MAFRIEPRLVEQVKKNNGYAVEAERIGKPRATLYKPSGEAMPNMPIDAFHLQKYLARGFTLYPPEKIDRIPNKRKPGRPRKSETKE